MLGDAGSHLGPDFDSLQAALDDPPTLDALTLVAEMLAQQYGARVIGAMQAVGSNTIRITLSAKVGDGKPGPVSVTVEGSLAGALGLKGAFAIAADRAFSTALKGATP